MEFSSESTKIATFDPRTNTDLAKGTITISDQVAAFLAEGPKTVKELAELCDCTEASVRTTVNANKRRFSRVQGGNEWELANPE